MPSIPEKRTLVASTEQILNTIRNNATQDYKNYVPKAVADDVSSIRAIGNVLMDYPTLQNEFLSALVNRIGRVIVTSKIFNNPLVMFKKGVLEYGETLEEIFVDISNGYQYDPADAEQTVFKREKPNVHSAFHVMNFTKVYPTTVNQADLQNAFLSIDGVTDLITKIINAVYNGATYDEFQTMKYLLAINILNGRLYGVSIPTIDETSVSDIAVKIKEISNDFTFMKRKYNIANVVNYTEKNSQYLITSSEFDATMGVKVLANAFNMNEVEFLGHRVLIDSFGDIDRERLDKLFEDNANYRKITDEEIEALKQIPAVIVDKDWFMVFDNQQYFTEQQNAKGLYWNYFYHVWKTFSVSPFENSAVFVCGQPGITSVTVSPGTATVSKGQKVQLNAIVQSESFAPKTVKWSCSDTNSIISDSGLLTITDKSASSITVTATSTFDGTKKGTATITVA